MVTPLPTQAVEILREQKVLTGSGALVFTSTRGRCRPLSENTLNAALHTLGYKGRHTAHGFRATARTLLVESFSYPEQWVEMQLGHAVRDANGRAYNRTTYLEQRKAMLQRWADYLDELRRKVVPLHEQANDARPRKQGLYEAGGEDRKSNHAEQNGADGKSPGAKRRNRRSEHDEQNENGLEGELHEADPVSVLPAESVSIAASRRRSGAATAKQAR